MPQSFFLVTLVIDDYDRAKTFYCDCLGFDCLQDEQQPEGKRWVVVKPKGGEGAALLLAQAADDSQREAIGNQTGGRVGSSSRPTILPAITRPWSRKASVFWRNLAMRSMAPSWSSRTPTATLGI